MAPTSFGWLGGRYPKQTAARGIYIVRRGDAAYFTFPQRCLELVFDAVMESLWSVVPGQWTGGSCSVASWRPDRDRPFSAIRRVVHGRMGRRPDL